jgi:hemerythrin
MEEFIKWDNKYSVGNLLLDNQHKTLIKLINELHYAMQNGKGKQALNGILTEVVSYTIDHFTNEEQLMTKYSFPELGQHRLEHKKLAQKAIELQTNYSNASAPLTIDVLQFLKEWLTNHIEKSDMKYKGRLK